ncbi:MAG: hypothetical protein CPDRYMAC_3689 [uncultured Paraburkholderia sp.]|nr:MAG: hypothetical protein CPDRYMAC_3689 [uncultured Paraburkholderia sp.]
MSAKPFMIERAESNAVGRAMRRELDCGWDDEADADSAAHDTEDKHAEGKQIFEAACTAARKRRSIGPPDIGYWVDAFVIMSLVCRAMGQALFLSKQV